MLNLNRIKCYDNLFFLQGCRLDGNKQGCFAIAILFISIFLKHLMDESTLSSFLRATVLWLCGTYTLNQEVKFCCILYCLREQKEKKNVQNCVGVQFILAEG